MAKLDAGKVFREKIAEAEAAVAAVNDPELKRVAFDKILDKLLGVSSLPATSHYAPTTTKSTPKQKASHPKAVTRG